MNTRINMMGCTIDNLSMSETLATVENQIKSGRPHQHGVINVDKIVKANRDKQIKSILNSCDLINADGMPVVWASRLLGIPLKERITGIDLFDSLMRKASEKGWRIFLLGAREEIVTRVKYVYQSTYPDLDIVGCRNGYWNAEQEHEIVENIKNSRADILFVAITSPKKEYFLGRYQKEMKVPFAMGVGGSFDVVAGAVKRAPRWMQNAGLEWFYRFLQEPRRMFKRYFIDDMSFFGLLLKEFMKSRFLNTTGVKEPRA